ncbi:TraV family lipoprotein [Roseateles chitinivorans]|uniref:TraV family lipoprotein n=1 Tax=Roseateles chitinivorans TaxID=2917965 RepID=UPI003D665EAE
MMTQQILRAAPRLRPWQDRSARAARAARASITGPCASTAVACLLSGCLNLSGLGGESKYACAAPEGVTCQSVAGTYANAVRNGAATPSFSQGPVGAATATAARPRQPATDLLQQRAPIDGPNADAALFNGLPADALRTQARVLRLWTKAWEDADGDLWDQGYVYVQITNGGWRIDHVHQKIRARNAPIRPLSAASSSANAAAARPSMAMPEDGRQGALTATPTVVLPPAPTSRDSPRLP